MVWESTQGQKDQTGLVISSNMNTLLFVHLNANPGFSENLFLVNFIIMIIIIIIIAAAAADCCYSIINTEPFA